MVLITFKTFQIIGIVHIIIIIQSNVFKLGTGNSNIEEDFFLSINKLG